MRWPLSANIHSSPQAVGKIQSLLGWKSFFRSLLLCHPTRTSPEDLSAPLPGQCTVPQRHPAIDHHMRHADGSLIRLERRSALAEAFRLEDREVRPCPRPNHAAVAQPESAG